MVTPFKPATVARTKLRDDNLEAHFAGSVYIKLVGGELRLQYPNTDAFIVIHDMPAASIDASTCGVDWDYSVHLDVHSKTRVGLYGADAESGLIKRIIDNLKPVGFTITHTIPKNKYDDYYAQALYFDFQK